MGQQRLTMNNDISVYCIICDVFNISIFNALSSRMPGYVWLVLCLPGVYYARPYSLTSQGMLITLFMNRNRQGNGAYSLHIQSEPHHIALRIYYPNSDP